MPKIQTYDQAGEYRPSGRVVQGVRTPADDGIARGVEKLGQATLEVAGRIQQANLDQELVKAETDLRVRMDKARQAIELDPETPDVAIPKRWQQESEAIIGEIGGTISSSRARELWTIRARGLQAEGDTWSVNLQRKRQVDGVRAGFIAMASDAETMAGDASISPETYASKIEGLRALNASHLASGFIDKEEAARREALLDGYEVKDRTTRWTSSVKALARAGQYEEAEALLQTKDIPEAALEDGRAAIEAERRKREADTREAQRLASNEIEVRILDGKGSRQEIDEAVASRRISVNDQPTLIRALREQQDRERVQAERDAALTPEQKKAWEAASADDRYFFASLSQTQQPLFMADPATWPQSLRDRFSGMTATDQEWVMNKRLTMRTEGGSADAVSKLAGDLMAEAKRWAPPDWMLGGTGKDALESAQNVEMTAQIQRLAEQLAPQLGGTPIQQKQAQEEIVRLFKVIDPKMNLSGVPAFQRARFNAGAQASADMTGVDWGLWNQASQMLGPDATTAQIAAAYTQAGGLNADKVR